MLEKQYEVGHTLCCEKGCDGFRCLTILEEFHEFTSGKSTSLSLQFMTSPTEESHANRILIILWITEKMAPNVSEQLYLLNKAPKFVFLVQRKHQVTMDHG